MCRAKFKLETEYHSKLEVLCSFLLPHSHELYYYIITDYVGYVVYLIYGYMKNIFQTDKNYL